MLNMLATRWTSWATVSGETTMFAWHLIAHLHCTKNAKQRFFTCAKSKSEITEKRLHAITRANELSTTESLWHRFRLRLKCKQPLSSATHLINPGSPDTTRPHYTYCKCSPKTSSLPRHALACSLMQGFWGQTKKITTSPLPFSKTRNQNMWPD